MIVTAETVKAAFEKHHQIYATQKGWRIPYHIEQWQVAQRAFGHRSFEDFHALYEELRRRWQVFRGSKSRHWSAKRTYNVLMSLDTRFTVMRLSDLPELNTQDITGLWKVVSAMADIKRTGDGASLVAVSKFLHFLNPRLFVIVDREMMWNWVFGHTWIWEPIEELGKQLRERLPQSIKKEIDFKYDLSYYLPLLLWAGQIVKKNPAITATFVDYLAQYSDSKSLLPGLEEYEAAAIEWFLLGLVELAPAGIELV